MTLKDLERGFRAEESEGVVQYPLSDGIEQSSVLPVRECRAELFMCWDVLKTSHIMNLVGVERVLGQRRDVRRYRWKSARRRGAQ